MEELLKKVHDFAAQAHGDQMRKYTTERYIVHPVRVMETCKQYDARLPVLAAALLHDVIEDTSVDAAVLSKFLFEILPAAEADQTLSIVIELTDVYVKSAYPHWNRNIRKKHELDRLALVSAEAQTIKYADIYDNCREIAVHDPEFAPRYLRECLDILKNLPDGNPDLRARALELLKEKMASLAQRII